MQNLFLPEGDCEQPTSVSLQVHGLNEVHPLEVSAELAAQSDQNKELGENHSVHLEETGLRIVQNSL